MTARRSGRPRLDAWSDVVDRLRAVAALPGRLLIVSDFDGTLAPIPLDPMGARIEPLARVALRRLARLAVDRPDRLRVVVLSGRRASDVALRVRVGGIDYHGDHGLEWGRLPRGVPAERLGVIADPSFAMFAESAEGLGRDVAGLLGGPAWLFVEAKGPSVAFHYRAAPDREGALRLIVQAVAARRRLDGPDDLIRSDGRWIVEYRPLGAGGKGALIDRLLDEQGTSSAIVLGDDRSDAEAFRAVAEAQRSGRIVSGLALAVHPVAEMAPEVVAAADLELASPRDAGRALATLARLLDGRTGAPATRRRDPGGTRAVRRRPARSRRSRRSSEGRPGRAPEGGS